MTRRTLGLLLIFALSFLWSPLTAAAPPGKMPRIGVLEFGPPPASPDWKTRSRFLQELRALGWLEGQNLIVEYRWAEGQRSRLPMLAAELVHLPVDVIVVDDTPAIQAVTQATTTIPIVMISVLDPMEWGSVATLARPGGNVTGVGGLVLELGGKLLEFLKEAAPGVTRMAILTDAVSPLRMVQETERAAQALGVHTHFLVVGYPDQFEPAIKEAIREGAGALIVLPSVFYAHHIRPIAALALQHGLPAIFWQRQFAEVGGLMAYGPSFSHLRQRAAAHVDKILKGAKPADLPLEQPTTFDLVINLKTAQALGLTVPSSLLFQATQLIR